MVSKQELYPSKYHEWEIIEFTHLVYRRFVGTKPGLQSRKASRVIRIELNGLLAKSEICTWLIQRFSKDNHQIISDYQYYTINIYATNRN